MIIGSGYDRDVGGAQGTGYTGLSWSQEYGIPVQDWYDLNTREQELWIQDVNRTTEQQNYSTDSDYAKVYVIKEGVDEYIIDPVVHTTQTVYEDVKGAVSYGFDTATLVGIGALILLMGR